MNKDDLIEKVLNQIVADLQYNDVTAIEELVKNIPDDILLNFICEDE